MIMIMFVKIIKYYFVINFCKITEFSSNTLLFITVEDMFKLNDSVLS